MNLSAPELLILAIVVVPAIITIWGIIDTAMRPTWAWERAGQSKTQWLLLQLLGFLLCGVIVGLISTVIYLATIRPQVRQQQDQWGPTGGPPYPGTPPPPGTSPFG